jgi:hypothetical protein
MATASHVQRLRAKPKSAGASVVTQRTTITTHPRVLGRLGERVRTASIPPRRYARRHRLMVAELVNRTAAISAHG